MTSTLHNTDVYMHAAAATAVDIADSQLSVKLLQTDPDTAPNGAA